MKELAVVGSEDFTLGFQLAGVKKAFPEAETESLERRVTELLDAEDVGILIIAASDVDRLSASTKRRISTSIEPVVIQMGGEGSGDLREKVKRAIGIDLYKD